MFDTLECRPQRPQSRRLPPIRSGRADGHGSTRSFPGEVIRVAYGVEPTSRTVAARITVANPEEVLKPGMFAQARITVGEIPDTLSVPASAVIRLLEHPGNTLKVFCVRIVRGRTAVTSVKPGYKNGDNVEILEGLMEGDEVIVDPSDTDGLDDVPIEVIPPGEK